MMQDFSDFRNHNRNSVVLTASLLSCLLVMRFIIILNDLFQIPFRIVFGLNILLIFIIPVILVFALTHSMDLLTCFALPLAIYGILFPVCQAFFLDPFALLGYPPYYFVPLIGGIGLGVIGIAGKFRKKRLEKSLVIYSLGISIIMINTANIIPVFWYVVTGDPTPLTQIPNFI